MTADCTPDSVVSLIGKTGNHLSVAAYLALRFRADGQSIRRLGLAAEGACTAAVLTVRRGALLPHLFTLACGYPQAVCFLLRFPCPGDIAPEPRLMPLRWPTGPEGEVLPASCPVQSGSSSQPQKRKSGSPSAAGIHKTIKPYSQGTAMRHIPDIPQMYPLFLKAPKYSM